jgi:hypothetical protein
VTIHESTGRARPPAEAGSDHLFLSEPARGADVATNTSFVTPRFPELPYLPEVHSGLLRVFAGVLGLHERSEEGQFSAE